MPGGKERALKRRIKSIEATKKITRAMELIAASQIAKAQARIAASRPYQEQLKSALFQAVSNLDQKARSLTSKVENPDSVLFLAIAGDRGLCGGYNNFVLRSAEKQIGELKQESKKTLLITVGKKSISYFRFRKIELAASFVGHTDRPTYEWAREIAEKVLELKDEVQVVKIISTRFFSVASQKVVTEQLLPLTLDEEKQEVLGGKIHASSEIEPDDLSLLELLLPQYVKAAIYSALLEASAAEHASRQRAMASATDNAEELIRSLARQMNRARQETITTEIMEIVGGAEALKTS